MAQKRSSALRLSLAAPPRMRPLVPSLPPHASPAALRTPAKAAAVDARLGFSGALADFADVRDDVAAFVADVGRALDAAQARMHARASDHRAATAQHRERIVTHVRDAAALAARLRDVRAARQRCADEVQELAERRDEAARRAADLDTRRRDLENRTARLEADVAAAREEASRRAARHKQHQQASIELCTAMQRLTGLRIVRAEGTTTFYFALRGEPRECHVTLAMRRVDPPPVNVPLPVDMDSARSAAMLAGIGALRPELAGAWPPHVPLDHHVRQLALDMDLFAFLKRVRRAFAEYLAGMRAAGDHVTLGAPSDQQQHHLQMARRLTLAELLA